MKFQIIDETEMEDFHRALREAGHAPDDFVLSEKANLLPTSGIGFETGTVTVQNLNTGIERVYPIGHGAIWPADVHQDLSAGLFKR